MPKVFSIGDFRRGLDTRRTALTAPSGSLRILENALLNPGGEIQKRFAMNASLAFGNLKPYCSQHLVGLVYNQLKFGNPLGKLLGG